MASCFSAHSGDLGEAVRALLTSSRVQDLAAHRKDRALLILRSSATVDQALRALAHAKVLSCPVVSPDEPAADPAGPAADGEEDAQAGAGPLWPSENGGANVEGFVDSRELLTSFLADLDVSQLEGATLLSRMRVLEEKGTEFATKRLDQLKDLGCDGDFLHSSQANCSLMEFIAYVLLNPKARGVHGGGRQTGVVHRVALFDNTGRIISIVSQTDIVRFLSQHRTKLGPLSSTSVDSLGMINRQVQSVPVEASALEAMKRMAEHHLSSLAVVDRNGALLGNFSLSDLRAILAEQFGALALPVGEYLALEHRTEYVEFNRVHEEGVVGSAGHRFVMDHVARRRPVTPGAEVGQQLVVCTANSTFGDVIDLLAKHRLHRVYVVDAQQLPVGIITCTDILRKLVELTK